MRGGVVRRGSRRGAILRVYVREDGGWTWALVGPDGLALAASSPHYDTKREAVRAFMEVGEYASTNRFRIEAQEE